MKRDRTKTYKIKRYWCSQNQRGIWFLNHGNLVLRWSEKHRQWTYVLSETKDLISADGGITWTPRQRKLYSKTPKEAWERCERDLKALILSYKKTLADLRGQLLRVQAERSSASPRRRSSTKKPRKVPTRKPSARSSPSTP